MPRHVSAEAKRGLSVEPKGLPEKCKPTIKEQQEVCRAQVVALELRRSEARKHRALRDANKFYDGVVRQYKAQ